MSGTKRRHRFSCNGSLFASILVAMAAALPGQAHGVASPTKLSDIEIASQGSSPRFTMLGERVFFRDILRGPMRPWITDGTVAGTRLLADVAGAPDGSYPGFGTLTEVNGAIVFDAGTDDAGTELWLSDGDLAGTMLLDIRPGIADSEPRLLGHLSGAILLVVDDGVHGAELWRSDGTPGGTTLVADINPGSKGSRPAHIGQLGDVDPGDGCDGLCRLEGLSFGIEYAVIGLGAVTRLGDTIEAVAINELGQVAGATSNAVGFFWDGSVLHDFGARGSLALDERTIAWGINASGQVVGTIRFPDDTYRAFRWEPGVVTNLGTYPGGTLSDGLDINDAGDVVAGGNVPPSLHQHPLLWRAGVWTDLVRSAETRRASGRSTTPGRSSVNHRSRRATA